MDGSMHKISLWFTRLATELTFLPVGLLDAGVLGMICETLVDSFRDSRMKVEYFGRRQIFKRCYYKSTFE